MQSRDTTSLETSTIKKLHETIIVELEKQANINRHVLHDDSYNLGINQAIGIVDKLFGESQKEVTK